MKHKHFYLLFVIVICVYFLFSKIEDLNKVLELRMKSERMFNFFVRETQNNFDSKENISSLNNNINGELQSMEQINRIISVLGDLSMFYAYNTNWGEHNISKNKLEYKELVSTGKSRQSKPSVSGNCRWVFHLSMPYTQEVNTKQFYSFCLETNYTNNLILILSLLIMPLFELFLPRRNSGSRTSSYN